MNFMKSHLFWTCPNKVGLEGLKVHQCFVLEYYFSRAVFLVL